MKFFTADTHFGHKRILEYCPERGYASLEEMNEGLIANWNVMVSPEDTIYHLGDVAFLPKAATVEICRRLNGYKVLVMGNHDLKWKPEFWKDEVGFDEVYKLGYGTTLDREGFHLSHYPYRRDLTAYDERSYLYHHAPEAGESGPKWLLHGHVHDRWQTLGRQINVGVDVWGNFPVSLEKLQQLSSNP